MPKGAIEALQEASALFAAGRLEEARRACRKLLTKRADIAEAQALLGEIYRRTGDEPRARECVARALKLRPGWGEAHVHLTVADVYADFQRLDEACQAYRAALALDPGLADARYNLAAALCASGRVPDAISELQALVEREPAAADARVQLVHLLQEERRFAELEAACRGGMELHPSASLYPNKLGLALWWRGQHEPALAAFRLAAERAQPASDEHADACLLEASGLLALGRYEAGWDAYRWRRTRRDLQGRAQLVRDPRLIAGEATPRRLRILCEQGLGDEIFFLRFAARLRERGHALSISCDPRLAPLLRSIPRLFERVNAEDETADFTLASGDLPLASGVPRAPPIRLPVEAERREAMAARLRAFGPPPYIAVTWRGGLMPDERKSPAARYWVKHSPPDLVGRALRLVDARIVVLQRRPQADEARLFAQGLGRESLDLSAANDDLRDALAVLSLVDEYVGVSNTNMHLRAGLEGKSARVLVLMPPEWRWGLEGSSSPWFPGFTLYRAAPGRDWSAALSRLEDELRAAAAQQK